MMGKTWDKAKNIRLLRRSGSQTSEKRMFFRLMALVTIPLIVMGMVSAGIYMNAESEKNRLMVSAYSKEITREYENSLSSLKEYYLETVNSDEFKWLTRQSEPPYSQFSNLKQIRRKLEGNYFIERFIDEYEFINVQAGWVLNNYGMFSYHDIRNGDDTELFLKEQETVVQSVYWVNRFAGAPPQKVTMRESDTVDSSGLRLIIKDKPIAGKVSWILSVKINEGQMRQMIDGYANLGYGVAVLNGSEVLLETDGEITAAYFAKNGKDSAACSAGENHKKYILKWNRGKISGLTYVIGLDMNSIKWGAAAFILAAGGVTAGFGFLLLVVRMTTGILGGLQRRLEASEQAQVFQRKELLLTYLLKGELDEEKFDEALKQQEIILWKSWRIIVMVCKSGETSEQELRKQYPRILKGLPEEASHMIFIAPACYQNRMVFITGAEGDEGIDIRTAQLYKIIKDYIADSLGCPTASGISRPFHNLQELARAYEEGTESLYDSSNQQSTEESTVVLFDDYSMMKQKTNVYDIIMENELIQAVESEKEEDGNRLLEMIINRMEAKGLIGIDRSFYLMRLITAIVNIPVAAGISLKDIFGEEQYNVLKRILGIYDRKKLTFDIEKSFLHPIARELSRKREAENEPESIHMIMDLIRDSRGNITLNECADQLNYHPNYLSKILKREKGATFTEIANGEKLMHAKYLLLTAEYSVAEISGKLQYNNVQNFIRFFKNQTGETPASFRRTHRK